MRSFTAILFILLVAGISCKKSTDDQNTGIPYTDITLPDTSGNLLSISDFDGKYRYVVYWASGCPSCRLENPELLDLYNRYKSKGFIILGISLDDSKSEWTHAIRQDNLVWPQLSDLKGWSSPATAVYDITYIPDGVFIDNHGYIVGEHFDLEALKEKLEYYFGK